MNASQTYSAFQAGRLIASGPGREVAAAVRAARGEAAVFVFDDVTGALIDHDLLDAKAAPAEPARGRGRPKLGVMPREVTLLPRHWDWLASQPGGASVALRKLVEEASRRPQSRAKAAATAAYTFLHAIAGDRPGYEEALRALFAGDRTRFAAHMATWPEDIRGHALRLGFPESTA